MNNSIKHSPGLLKRTFAVLLMICLVIAAVPVNGFAAETKANSNSIDVKKTSKAFTFTSIDISGVDIESMTEGDTVGENAIWNIKLADSCPDDAEVKISFTYKSNKSNKFPLIMNKESKESAESQYGEITNITINNVVTGFNIKDSVDSFNLVEGKAEVSYYYYLDPTATNGGSYKLKFFKGQEDSAPKISKADVAPGNGQWMFESDLYDTTKHNAAIVTPYQKETSIVNVTAESCKELKLNDQIQADDGNGNYALSLTSSVEGTSNKITLTGANGEPVEYTITCYQQRYSNMPDAVTDYFCVNSQYTNGGRPAFGAYGRTEKAVATLRGGKGAANTDDREPEASLGNYGGYITYYYEDAIMDNPNNPYGIDFIVYGNSSSPTNGLAEPGNVLVSEDGQNWYNLAGSWHYDDVAVWDYKITYTKDNEGVKWVTSDGKSGSTKRTYPLEFEYPLFPWTDETRNGVTLGSVYLNPSAEQNEYGNTLPPFPAFGYADCGIIEDSNVAYNPYTGMKTNVSDRTDGFDLAWAVDGDGKPVTFEKGIHYIKVETANFIENSSIGEKSTEVNMVRTAAPTENAVGKTAAPESITIDGTPVELQEGTYVYDTPVNGVFDVKVKAAENANIYINSVRGNTASFDKAAHGMVRVIIQEGQKEPVIYYFNITEGTAETTKTTTVIFDGNGGQIGDVEKTTMYFDKNSTDKSFPTPVREGYEFQGWYMGQMKYDGYTEDMGESITLTAKWKAIGGEATPSEKKINVTFRLIGATQAKTPVDLSTGKMDSQYVNWMQTKSYELPEDSTVYDLFMMAMKDSGLKQVGAESGYVKTINAPSKFGGYALSEKDNGLYSGWMYTMNGKHTDGIKIQKLTDNAEVIFHYVNDYRYEVSDWADLGGAGYPAQGDGTWHDGWLKAPDVSVADAVVPSEQPPQPVIQDVTATVNKDGEATSNVTASDVDKLVDAAVKQSATLIEINVKDADKADKVTVELPKTSVSDIANKTDATLQVTTPAGIVTMDKQVMKEIVKAAEGNDIQIIVEKQTPLPELQKLLGTDISYTEVTILSNGHEIKTFGTAKLKLNLNVPAKIKDKKLMAAHVDENGKLEKMPGKLVTIDGKPFYQIETPHLSHFVVAEEAVIDEIIKEQAAETDDEKLARIKKGVQNTTIKITKTSKGKGWIKIKWKKSKGYKVDYYEVFRKTGKNSKFGKKAFYKTKKHGMTGSYKNTKALKKGKRYYYKVRGIRVIDGKKYYTKWSKTYYRIAK